VTSGVRVSRAVKREFFDLVCLGMATTDASVRLGVSRRTGWHWWHDAGGMKLRNGKNGLGGLASPGDLTRPGGRGHRVSFEERVEIMRGRDAGLSFAEIGVRIGRDRSVIWREYRRNCLPNGDYHALMAHARATRKARRPKAFALSDHRLCSAIEAWMDDGWSPRLISQMLAHDYPDDKLMQVSHETIYQSLYVQTRGQLRADLHKCLSTKRSTRQPRGKRRTGVYASGEIFTIRARPAEAADRAVPGHWEGDLILGAGHRSAIGTLVERATRFTILLHLPVDHTAESVAAAMIEAMSELPEHLRRSITWDRGSEMADWRNIQLQLDSPVYFCDPRSPWQRGTNENTNRLLRFWFEKGSDLSGYTKADLKRVADKLNTRPRPTLDLDTPAQRLAALISQAA
jgi:IS30 family transposase